MLKNLTMPAFFQISTVSLWHGCIWLPDIGCCQSCSNNLRMCRPSVKSLGPDDQLDEMLFFLLQNQLLLLRWVRHLEI